jgi:hypothetical protein
MQRLAAIPILGFIPWIVFWVVADSRSTWEFGAIAALIAALILLVPTIEGHNVKMLDLATVAFFAGVAIAGIVVGPHDGDWLDRWSNTLSSGVLGGLVLASLLFLPFTEQYARESTPPEIWHTTRFRRTNQILTLVWGGVFVRSRSSARSPWRVPPAATGPTGSSRSRSSSARSSSPGGIQSKPGPARAPPALPIVPKRVRRATPARRRRSVHDDLRRGPGGRQNC